MTQYPDCYRKLQDTLAQIFPNGEGDWKYEKVKNVPYLDYIVHETLRLKPSVPAGTTRLTPPSGMQIDDVNIPGDVVVSVPTYTIQRDPRYWNDASEFIPERWEKLSTEKAPWLSFSRGQYNCPGRNLAMMELRMVLSRIALRFDISLVSKRDGDIFDRDAKDTFTLAIPPLPMLFTRRNP